jgi:ribonuclease P protein component
VLWVSPRIVPGTSAASRRMDSANACRRAGDVKSLPVVAKRDGNGSRSNYRRNTPAPKTPPRYPFPRTQRLSRAVDIDTAKRTGKRVKAGNLDVRIAPSPLAYARVGIVVPKYKHHVVDRNRLRRRLRELVRTRLLPVLTPCDVLIRPFPHAYAASFDTLMCDMDRVISIIGTKVR